MIPSFGLIIVGDEILSGKRADKHMPKVIELLSARGLSLTYADYVGDNPDRITATLRNMSEAGAMIEGLWNIPAGSRLTLVVDTVDLRYAGISQLGGAVTFSSPASAPSVLKVPLH